MVGVPIPPAPEALACEHHLSRPSIVKPAGDIVMCEHGTIEFNRLRATLLNRRSVLRATAAGTLALGAGAAHADETHIRSTHGSGFCNLNYFLSNALQTAKDDGVMLDFVITPTFAEQVTFLGTGQVDAGLIPYTSFVALFDAGAPVKIIAGGGIEGCVLLAQPGLDSPAKLKGKTLGTFQMDTLEVLPYDWFKLHGVDFKDVNVRYMGNTPEAVEAFKAGALDMICTIEPYGTALLNDVKGSVMLSDGTDIYGRGYTDCVLAVRAEMIERNPASLKSLIKGMMRAQLMAESKPEETLQILVGPYYKTSIENARIAMAKQPSVVDARAQTQFILDRVESITAMGYIKKKPGRDAIDWRLLEQVIAANQDLYGKLKYKSAA
jgi:NitT/TauT family transport system substrate-binding protein